MEKGLRTLKDLDMMLNLYLQEDPQLFSRIVKVSELKQEAIKWVKEFDDLMLKWLINHKDNESSMGLDSDDLFHHFLRCKEDIDCEICKEFNIKDFWKNKFNITESELENA
jgi:hypothetical protein